MGITPLSSIINLHVTTPGRRIFALREVKQRAARHGLSDLVARIDQALEHETRTADLEGRWRAGRTDTVIMPRDIDPRIDRTLLVMEQMLIDCIEDMDADVSRHAGDLVNLLFPNTATVHVQLPYIDQLAANEYVLRILDAAEHREWVERLGLRIYADRLRNLNDAFRDALLAHDAAPTVDFADVRAARDQAQENYLAVAARISGLYCDPAGAEMRTELLQPIIEQNDELRAYHRLRRRPADIDADTGQPLPDDTDAATGEPGTEPTAEATGDAADEQ